MPPETYSWVNVERIAHDLFQSFGFGEIRPPVIETAELFEKSVGTDTDVGGKELYNWVDSPRANKAMKSVRWKGKMTASKVSQRDSAARLELEREADAGDFDTLPESDRVALRPEATASVCRAYVGHEMQNLPQPVKLYYIGPMFRRERPQKGRFREFYQIGAEVLDNVSTDSRKDPTKELEKDATVDAEVLEMLMTFFDKCGLRGTTLYINSIGHNSPNCRGAYVEKLKTELTKIKDKLGPDSQRRIDINPLRVLDSKLESEQPSIELLPRVADHLCPDCAAHYSAVKRELDLRAVKYEENWRLVRGLDYYMRTTFEITSPGLGSQNAVCGGGRYDGLVELLGGPPTKGIGFAIGEDRLILSLQESSAELQNSFDETLPGFGTALQRPDVAVAGTSTETWDKAVQLAASLRKRGLSVFLPRSGTKLQRVFDAAHRLGVRVAILVGENELKQNDYVIRVLNPLVPDRPRDFPVKTDDVVLFGKIVKLRQALERALLRLAAGKPELDSQRSMLLLVDRLVEKKLLPAKMAGAVKDVLPTLNRTIHGESLASDSVQWALAYGNLLVNELENLNPVES